MKKVFCCHKNVFIQRHVQACSHHLTGLSKDADFPSVLVYSIIKLVMVWSVSVTLQMPFNLLCRAIFPTCRFNNPLLSCVCPASRSVIRISKSFINSKSSCGSIRQPPMAGSQAQEVVHSEAQAQAFDSEAAAVAPEVSSSLDHSAHQATSPASSSQG